MPKAAPRVWYLTANGKKQSLHKWEIEMGIAYSTLKTRMKLGWSPEEVVNLRPNTRPRQGRKCKHSLTVDGVTLTIPEWSFATGIHQKALYQRLAKGLTGKDVITPKPKVMIEVDGSMYTIKEMMAKTGLKYGTIYNRIKRGWPVKAAINPELVPQLETSKGRWW
jgi:predicted DNA-binding transcriptional regulator AlpA